MTSDTPPDGWRLLDAISELQSDENVHFRILLAGTREPVASEQVEVARRRADAWAALSKRLQRGELHATGFAGHQHATSPTPIHPAFFNNARPDFELDSVESHGVIYGGVRIGRGPASGLQPVDAPKATVRAEVSKGGAPDGYPWDAFIQEIVRLTWNGAFSTRPQLRDLMRNWCEQEWGHLPNTPDDRTIKRRLERYCPEAIPNE